MAVSHHAELDLKMTEKGDLDVGLMGGILWGRDREKS